MSKRYVMLILSAVISIRQIFGALSEHAMIDLKCMDRSESGIYVFGKKRETIDCDAAYIGSVFQQDTEDRRFLIGQSLFIEHTDVQQCARTSVLCAHDGDGRKYSYLHQVKLFVKRDPENTFVGFAVCGSPVDDKSFLNFKFLFIDPAFRRKGHATILLAHVFHYLQSKHIRMQFRAYQSNPACRLYDRLVGFKRKDAIFGDLWIYKQIKPVEKDAPIFSRA